MMDDYTACGLAEGFIEADDEQQIIDAWQHRGPGRRSRRARP